MSKVTFKWSPSVKAFPNATFHREADIDLDPTSFKAVKLSVNGAPLAPNVVAYLTAFGFKQVLANSYASAKKEAEWTAAFDKRLDKLLEGRGDWEGVFTGTNAFESECRKIAIARLVALAAKKGRALPKRDSDKFKELLSNVMTAQAESIEAEARKRISEVAAVAVAEDELDLSDLSDD